jgi:hypothetical protein
VPSISKTQQQNTIHQSTNIMNSILPFAQRILQTLTNAPLFTPPTLAFVIDNDTTVTGITKLNIDCKWQKPAQDESFVYGAGYVRWITWHGPFHVDSQFAWQNEEIFTVTETTKILIGTMHQKTVPLQGTFNANHEIDLTAATEKLLKVVVAKIQ